MIYEDCNSLILDLKLYMKTYEKLDLISGQGADSVTYWIIKKLGGDYSKIINDTFE